MYIYVKFNLESDDYYGMTTIPDDIYGRSHFMAIYERGSDIMDPIMFDNPEYCGFAKCYVSIAPEDFHPDSGKFLIFPVSVEMKNEWTNIIDPGLRITFRFKADIDDQKNKEE